MGEVSMWPPQVVVGGVALDVQVTEMKMGFRVCIFEHAKRTKADEPLAMQMALSESGVEEMVERLALRADKILRARAVRRAKIMG